MIKNLSRHGNSWALVIDKPILELLNIDPTTPLQITTDGQTLIVAPANTKSRQAKVQGARKKVNGRYSKVFKKLAE